MDCSHSFLFRWLDACSGPLDRLLRNSRVLHEDVDEDGTERGLVDENPRRASLQVPSSVATNDIFALAVNMSSVGASNRFTAD